MSDYADVRMNGGGNLAKARQVNTANKKLTKNIQGRRGNSDAHKWKCSDGWKLLNRLLFLNSLHAWINTNIYAHKEESILQPKNTWA